ncbi:MAG TPA: hypothetical protein DCQ37_22450 [Desulfobacteraceae bacterium]|jgi:soluble lytic murein transglycosylase-like protein|nr:hypothetical protein [Desulfobacteraceae bacterium]
MKQSILIAIILLMSHDAFADFLKFESVRYSPHDASQRMSWKKEEPPQTSRGFAVDMPTHTPPTYTPEEQRTIFSSGLLRLEEELAPYRKLIERTAESFGLEPSLVSAVIKAESNFSPKGVSYKGAQGMMQLMPGTASDMGVNNPFDPVQNIIGGVKYLKLMLQEFGNVKLALAAYNAGPERVKAVNRIPNIRETQDYVEKVINYEKLFRKIFPRDYAMNP